MSKAISREIVSRYIEEYYKKEYEIDEKRQPNFWRAVLEYAIDPNTDVSNLLMKDKDSDWCIKDGVGFSHISIFFKDAKTCLDAVKIIANEIIESENREDANMQLFLLEKRVKRLEESVDNLRGYHTFYC